MSIVAPAPATKTRKPRSGLNEMQARNLLKRKEQQARKEAKQQKELQGLFKTLAASKEQNGEQSTTTPTKGKNKAKKAVKKELTPAQKEKRDNNKAERKKSPAAFMGKKVAQTNKTNVQTRINERKIKERWDNGLDKFRNPRGFHEYIPNKQSALFYAKQMKESSAGEIECPYCQHYAKPYFIKTRNMYACKACKRQFSITKNSIYAHAHIALHRLFDVMINDLFNKGNTTVKEAKEILECSMKSAHAALTKIRLNAFLQKHYKIAKGSVLVIDTMSVIGRNHNRKDYAKLSKEEIYAQSIQVLTIKIKGGYTLYFVIENLKEETILAILREILPEECTIICDEHASFDNIDKIEGKKITLERVNHSAGDHGDGSAESANARLKNPIKAHGNVFSAQGVQGMANLTAFKANTAQLSLHQKFDIALLNCLMATPQIIHKAIRGRRSSFVRLITALQKLNPDIIITADSLKKIPHPAKVIKLADAIAQKEKNERRKAKLKVAA